MVSPFTSDTSRQSLPSKNKLIWKYGWNEQELSSHGCMSVSESYLDTYQQEMEHQVSCWRVLLMGPLFCGPQGVFTVRHPLGSITTM